MFNSGKTTFDYLKGAAVIGFIALGGFIFVAGLIIAAGVFESENSRPGENSGESQLQKQTGAEKAALKNNSAEGVYAPDEKVSAEKTIAVKSSQINVSELPPIKPAATLPPKSVEKNDFETTSPMIAAKSPPSAKTTIPRPAEVFDARQNPSTKQVYSRENDISVLEQKIAERRMMNDRRALRINRTMLQETRINRPFRGSGRRW